MSVNIEDKLSFLEKQIESSNFDLEWNDSGIVISVGDRVVRLMGLNNVQAGEIIEFENGVTALALNLEERSVGAVLLSRTGEVSEGTRAKRTYKIASVKVNENLIGRVLDGFGNPIDGKGEIEGKFYEMPVERKGPGIEYRQPVNEPLQTGIKSIDSMIPIGKGQRELIIGDRQTGKTSIAIETILNQKQFFDKGEPVYCIYVAVGQKQSTVKGIYSKLYKAGALKYTIIVTSGASDPAAMQYYAPFTGEAIGEFFRDTGRSALIIYDDLSKQAVAYREISLLLERPPGREAYPGDVFYLHSRLLERAAKIIKNDEIAKNMNDLPNSIKDIVKGGGSLTAIPIVETKEGDVSAYIPTNVISITDGQIFLDKDLFNSGFRPAINVGISVSRVGSSAQNKAMKKIAGKLKLTQAEFTELEAFSTFGVDLDPITQKILTRGKINNEMFKQKLNTQLSTGEECSIIYASINGYLDKIDLKNISKAEAKFLSILNTNNKDLIDKLSNGEWNKEIENELIKACEKFQNSNLVL